MVATMRIWTLVGSCLWLLALEVCGQFGDKPPPVLHLERNWILQDTEAIDSVVTRIRADNDNSGPLVYGLEARDDAELPFRIDNVTGVVYLNASLKDRGGQDLFLYVTASDGEVLPAKAEVWVKILNSSAPQRSPGFNRPAQFPATPGLSNGGGWGHPPFLNFPGFRPRPPPQNPLGFPPQRVPFPQQQNRTYAVMLTTTTTTTTPSVANRPETPANVPPSSTNNGILETAPRTTLAEVPLTPLSPSTLTPTTTTTTTTTMIPSSTSTAQSVTELPVRSVPDLTTTLIPVVSVCAIFLVVGVVALLFRRKICLGKSKNAKDDMQKEPSGGIILQDDPTITMQQWRGPRAFSNRYEPWERDAQPQQTGLQEAPAEKGDHWEFPRHRLKVFNILGEGAFGQVWRCEAIDIGGKSGVSVVAVKTLKENASEKEQTDLVSELDVMKSLEPHPNVVRLLGCCTEKEPLFVVMEFVACGKLQSYLRNSRAERFYGNMHGQSKTLTSRDLTSFVYQVARGMEYVSSKGIIHRDLAARNVLITDDHTCKVADFGFARDVKMSHVYERKSEGRLPIRWMAPESLYDNIFSVKSDVWSFGIFIWEVVTLGSTPYPGLSAADVMRKVRDGLRLDKPEHCRRELYNIMYYCWDNDAKERPTFAECVALLEKLLLTETDYIELERFPDHSYYNMLSLSGEKL